MTEESRDNNIQMILALSSLRRESGKQFLKMALDIMSNQQIYVLLQQMAEWIEQHPPQGK